MIKLWLKSFFLVTVYYYSSALASDVGFNDALYQKIINEFQDQYKIIGSHEALKILDSKNSQMGIGLNTFSFSYRKPFIDFGLEIERNLAPDLFSDTKWIVTDTLLIEIEASKILSRLKNDQKIDINDKNLAMYAGIVFKRKFTWVHFADSFKDGLTLNLEKLFFPFLSYNSKFISQMSINDLLTKEDMIGFKAGGLATIPINQNLSISTGFLSHFQKLSKTEVYVSQRIDNGESDVHISTESSKITTNDFNLTLIAGFFDVIKLNLLSYDFSFEKNEGHRVFMVFPQSYLKDNISKANIAVLNSILKNKNENLEPLRDFVISEQEKISLAISHKYNFLLMGGMKSATTEQVTISNKMKNITYFRHYFEKIKYIENPWSKILGSIIYSLTKTNSRLIDLSHESRKVSMEYASVKNLLENKEDLRLANERVLSILFEIQFTTLSKNSFIDKAVKKKNIFYLDNLAELPSEISDKLQRNELMTPSNFNAHFLIQQSGISYLNNLSISYVFDQFNTVCTHYPKTTFFNFRNLFDHCNYTLQSDYSNYSQNLKHHKVTASVIDKCENKAIQFIFNPSKRRNYIKSCLDLETTKTTQDVESIPLWDLKNLFNSLIASANDKISFYNLFGVSNVFHYGNWTSKTNSQKDFSISYHAGLFQNLGVIDDFMRVNNLRSPSSIFLGQ